MKFSKATAALSALAVSLGMGLALPAQAADWPQIEAQAKGQTVYFNAWGGGEAINAYIAWAAKEVQTRYGVTVKHVKITDAAEVVKRVQTEVAAGRSSDGSVDLM